MKAKIKATGEIVEVYHETQHGQTENIFKEAVFINGRTWKDDELEFIQRGSLNEALEEEIRMVAGDYEQVEVAWNNDFDFIARHFAEWGKKQAEAEIQAQSMAIAHGCPAPNKGSDLCEVNP